MQHKMQHAEQKVEQVTDALVARRRFINKLAIAAGAGALAAANAYGKAGGSVSPNNACTGSEFCTAYPCPVGQFQCSGNFICVGGYQT
jgi:hypothetical protein